MTKLVEITRTVVFPWNCDHYGHMNVRWYAHHFDDASYLLWTLKGMSTKELSRRKLLNVVANTTTNFRKETRAGDLLVIRGGFTVVGNKSVRLYLEMANADNGEICADQTVTEVFFDAEKRCSTTIPDDIRRLLEAVIEQADD